MENTIMMNSYKRTGPFLTFLFCFYIFFCYFEPYLNHIIGSSGKYVIFFVIVCFLFSYKALRIEWYHLSVFLWFLLKVASIMWGSINYIVTLHFFSQIGMVLLFIIMTVATFDDRFTKAVVDTSMYASGFVGALSLFFSADYQSELFSVRQVLTIFGAQNDPNDQAAFLLVGIAIAFYFLFQKKEKKKFMKLLFVSIIFINAYAIFKTGSRAGLLTFILLGMFASILSKKKLISLKTARNIAVVSAAFVLLFFIAKSFLPPNTFERIFLLSTYEGGSGRIDKWMNALQIFRKHPLIGGGWGSYWGYNNQFNVVHNTFLSVLTDGGIIGFTLLFFPVFFIAFLSFRRGFNLPLLLFITGLMPSLFLDAINKRFFWNALIIAFMLFNSSLYKERVIHHTEQVP